MEAGGPGLPLSPEEPKKPEVIDTPAAGEMLLEYLGNLDAELSMDDFEAALENHTPDQISVLALGLVEKQKTIDSVAQLLAKKLAEIKDQAEG